MTGASQCYVPATHAYFERLLWLLCLCYILSPGPGGIWGDRPRAATPWPMLLCSLLHVCGVHGSMVDVQVAACMRVRAAMTCSHLLQRVSRGVRE